jgi:chemotaxis protein MotA
MISLPLGIIAFVALLLLSTPMSSWATYINGHSILIVLGGTFAIFAISTPWSIMKVLVKSVKELFEREEDLSDFAEELAQLAETRQLSKPSKNPLINYALELWDNGTSTEIFLVLISQRRDSLESSKTEALSSLKNLAKYPPALGMTGTVMGMVTLFANLSAENKAGIGPALGLAMTATFFGLLLANGIVMPISDRLAVHHMRWRNQMTSVYELLLLVNRREPSTLVRGEVNDRIASAA